MKTDKSRFEFLQSLLQKFIIRAPESGMLIYTKTWNGQKITKGSMIQTWSPVVATLPDLSTMVSKTFINEVDIRKISVGQTVDIGLDAFPDKKLTGKITSVSNIGEQNPNADSKVFEVTVEIDGSDPTLRPAMTTSNTILAEVITNEKVQVALGKSNENEITIIDGLSEADKVYLSTPNDTGGSPIVLLVSEAAKIGIND